MGKLLTSTALGKENVKDLSHILKYKYARNKFVKILYQDKFTSNLKHCLDEKTFQELYEIIMNSLLYAQNDSNYEDIRLITKSLFCYYKTIELKNKTTSVQYLYQ